MLLHSASDSVSQTAWLIALSVLAPLFCCQCSVYDSGSVSQIETVAKQTRDNPVIMMSTVRADAGEQLGPDEFAPLPAPPSNDKRDAGAPVAKCGDGQVNAVERCDTAIKAGQPGACPTECPPLAECVPRILNGTGCQTECVLRQLTCESGDGCCPGNCTKDNDLDCSARCGDGIVQTTSGETCEPESDQPCITSEETCDDDDACTVDRVMGSEANCNVACTHEPIQTPDSDDGCCPPGANANSDPDCEPSCGNRIEEDGEDCDGSDDCDPNCKLINGEEIMLCQDLARNDCERCACEKCTATELACRVTLDLAGNQLCGNIVACSQENRCIGTPCYCGASIGCTIPSGPCRAEIERAGGTALQVAQQVGDPSTLVGKAYAADQCRVAQCEAACRGE